MKMLKYLFNKIFNQEIIKKAVPYMIRIFSHDFLSSPERKQKSTKISVSFKK